MGSLLTWFLIETGGLCIHAWYIDKINTIKNMIKTIHYNTLAGEGRTYHSYKYNIFGLTLVFV